MELKDANDLINQCYGKESRFKSLRANHIRILIF